MAISKKKNQDEENNDEYKFVTETIKKRPINAKKVIRRILFTIVLAILFGIVSSVTFIVIYPKLIDRFYPEADTRPVTVPVHHDEVVDYPIEEFVPPEGDDGVEAQVADTEADVAEADNGSEPPESSEVVAPADENTEEAPAETENQTTNETHDNSNEEEKKEESEAVVINQVVETIEKTLELDDYRGLLRKISSIGTNTQKSIVTVSGKKANTDWFNNSYVDNNSSIGVILADNGRELLIASPVDILNGATNVDVTFSDGLKCPATIRKIDKNTGLCIVAVNLSEMSDSTKDKVEMAQFGSISAAGVGAPVVAVGAPYGTSGSIAIGQITSNSVVIDKTDTNVRLISTDIYGSTNASGVLVNYNGRIVGIICHEQESRDMPNLIRAYSAADLSDIIEKLSNGKDLACLGILGTDVTKEANEEYNVPYGAYVKEVVVDSPAMNVGIRNGDVITKIGTTEITSYDDYKSAMLLHEPGDIVNISLLRPGGSDYTNLTYEVTLEDLE